MKFFKKIFPNAATAIVAGLFLAITATAATTIGTNIQTDGTFSVSGLASLLGQASTTRLSVFDRLYIGGAATTTIFGGSATSTFSGGIETPAVSITSSAATSTFANGISLSGGCFFSGGSCLTSGSGISASIANTWTALQQFASGASSSAFSAYDGLFVGRTSTTTIRGDGGMSSFSGDVSVSGATTLSGTAAFGGGTAVSGIVFGYCTISNSSSIGVLSAKYFNCTGATGITTSHRVFIQATSSLPDVLTIQAASSSAADTINLRVYNLSSLVGTAPGNISLNFFGIR